MGIFESTLDVGEMFMPGTDFLDAMDMAVSVAKTFNENVLGPLDYFNNFLNSQCGMSGMSVGANPMSLFLMLIGASDSLGTSAGCSRKLKASCTKPKPNPAAPKDLPRSDPKDPWEGETPPETDVPGTCSRALFGRQLLQSRAACKTEPDVEAEGYSYTNKNQEHDGMYPSDIWSIQGLDRFDATLWTVIAVLRVEKDAGRISIEYAENAADDTLKKLKLRDMVCCLFLTNFILF